MCIANILKVLDHSVHAGIGNVVVVIFRKIAGIEGEDPKQKIHVRISYSPVFPLNTEFMAFSST